MDLRCQECGSHVVVVRARKTMVSRSGRIRHRPCPSCGGRLRTRHWFYRRGITNRAELEQWHLERAESRRVNGRDLGGKLEAGRVQRPIE